jgi:hypothetical protein
MSDYYAASCEEEREEQKKGVGIIKTEDKSNHDVAL